MFIGQNAIFKLHGMQLLTIGRINEVNSSMVKKKHKLHKKFRQFFTVY